MDEEKIKERVKERYKAVAIQSTSCCGPGCCSGDGSSSGLLVDYGLVDADLPANLLDKPYKKEDLAKAVARAMRA